MAWLQEDEVFVAKYARARKLAAAFNEHRAVEIALRATPENVQVAKLQFDALKWQMSKQDPKVYGDKPGDVHVTTAVNNFVVMSEERQRQLQERHAVALKGR